MSIADGDALQRWSDAVRRTFWSRELPVVTFAFARLSTPHNLSLTARARQLRHACGCASSGFFMSMTVVSLVLASFFSDSSMRMPTAVQGLTAAGWILFAGAAGKLAGIAWARWRLVRLADGLRATAGILSTDSR